MYHRSATCTHLDQIHFKERIFLTKSPMYRIACLEKIVDLCWIRDGSKNAISSTTGFDARRW